MTIQSAKFNNSDNSTVELQTEENGLVFVPLTGDDVSGGWRSIYNAWVGNGGETDPHEIPAKTIAQALAEGEAYLDEKGLNNREKMLLTGIAAGTTNPEIKATCNSLLAWVLQIYIAARTNPAQFNASDFGEPPISAEEIIQLAAQ